MPCAGRMRNWPKSLGTVARKDGNAAKAFAKAAKQLSAEYDVPYPALRADGAPELCCRSPE